MKAHKIYPTILIATIAGSAGAGVIITGIVDGPLVGGNPKAIELYIDGTVDFTGFDLFKSANGGTFGAAGDLDSLGIITDSFVYILGNGTTGLVNFQNVFGISGDFANTVSLSSANGNGNDGFQIVDASSTVVDQIWQQDSSDFYLDSYLYRIDGTGPEGASWNASNWIVSGNNTLDGLDAMEIAAAVPFGTYLVPSPGAISLLTIGGLFFSGSRNRSV